MRQGRANKGARVCEIVAEHASTEQAGRRSQVWVLRGAILGDDRGSRSSWRLGQYVKCTTATSPSTYTSTQCGVTHHTTSAMTSFSTHLGDHAFIPHAVAVEGIHFVAGLPQPHLGSSACACRAPRERRASRLRGAHHTHTHTRTHLQRWGPLQRAALAPPLPRRHQRHHHHERRARQPRQSTLHRDERSPGRRRHPQLHLHSHCTRAHGVTAPQHDDHSTTTSRQNSERSTHEGTSPADDPQLTS
jgi:hypothetical protein